MKMNDGAFKLNVGLLIIQMVTLSSMLRLHIVI